MLYAGARYYMPNIGRWMSVDPLVHMYPSHSPYNYVLNNPLRFTDPTGTCVVEDPRTGECAFKESETMRMGTARMEGRRKGERGDDEEEEDEGRKRRYSTGEYEVIELGVPPELVGGIARGARLGLSVAQRGLNWIKGRMSRKGVQTIDANKLNHIFGQSRHNLGPLVEQFGSQQATYTAVQGATQNVIVRQGITGVFETTVRVGGHNVVVRGRVIDGVVRIGTFFIP